MPNTVRNESRPGIYAKLKTVERWIEQYACEWIIKGHSFRELSTSERLERMRTALSVTGSLKDSKKPYYGLPPINPSGEKEIMPKSAIWTSRVKFDCLVQAQQLAQNL